MTIAKNIPEHIKRTCRALGFALWIGDRDQWFGVSAILRARLTPEQRAALAYMALRALPPETAADVANAVLPGPISSPIAPLLNYMDEAAFWADMASQEERDAYMLACYNRSPALRQAAFLEFVKGRAAA